MAHQIFNLPPQQPLSAAGRVLPGAKLYFYVTGTSTPSPVYTTSARDVAHSQPIVADAGGRFSTVYLNPDVQYKATVTDANDVLLYSVDPVNDQIEVRQEGDVREFGAVGDGFTDDTEAFQAAAASGIANLWVGPGPFVITDSIPISTNQHWIMNGSRFLISGTTLELFTASAVNDWAIIGRWSVTGDNNSTGSTSGSAAGLRITDCMRFYVGPAEFKNIKGWGIRIRPGSSTSNRGEKGVIDCPHFVANYRGLECEAGTGAEYINVQSPIANRNATAWRIAAGNLNITGGSSVDNTLAFELVNGTNHGHGIISGHQCNHNTTQIYADTVTNGQTFTGCHFYQGIIHFDHSTGVVVKSGILDVDTYRFEESDGCGFIDNTMPMGYANSIDNNYNTSESFTVWNNNRTSLGEPWNGQLGNIKGVRVRNVLGSSQVIAAASITPANGAAIKLDDTANESANQATQTAYDCYDATTGIYTVLKGGDGHVTISAQLVVTYNAADAGDFQIYVRSSARGDFYFVGETISTTQTIFRYEGSIPASLNDTFVFRIEGAAVANAVTITNSGGTKAFVEGL